MRVEFIGDKDREVNQIFHADVLIDRNELLDPLFALSLALIHAEALHLFRIAQVNHLNDFFEVNTLDLF